MQASQQQPDMQKVFERLGQAMKEQAKDEEKSFSMGEIAFDTQFYAQFKDNPAYAHNINKIKAKYGKALDLDYNDLISRPISENRANMSLFIKAAEELGLKLHSTLCGMVYIGSVVVDIDRAAVLFSGVGKSARVNTYNITYDQIFESLIETSLNVDLHGVEVTLLQRYNFNKDHKDTDFTELNEEERKEFVCNWLKNETK